MITVNEAIANASVFAHQMYPIEKTITELEEVELSEDSKFWLVTLSFEEISDYTNRNLALFGSARKLKYKVFKVDINDGSVTSMKIRTVKS